MIASRETHIESEINTKDRFIHDDKDRLYQASQKITDHIQHLSIDWRTKKSLRQIRDESLSYLKGQRDSEYYQGVKAKVLANESLTPNEYIYFVLTTENLQLVDVEMLECAQKHYSYVNIEENLSLVKAALHYQHAIAGENKLYWQQELADSIRFFCVNGIRPLFINLAGVDLTGADLLDVPKGDRGRRSTPHLNFADLSGAKLDGCNMFALEITHSDLTGASLRNVFGDRKGEVAGPRIHACLARCACLDGIKLFRTSFQGCDFTGASFENMKAQDLYLGGSVFNHTSFRGARLENTRDTRDVSFQYADLRGATLIRIGFGANDFTHARFMNSECLNVPSDLKAELDRVDALLFQDIGLSNWWSKCEMPAINKLVARDVERCIDERIAEPSMRRDFLDVAIQHRIFRHLHDHVDMSSWLSSGAKSIYNTTFGTLFAKYYSDNPAIKYLEELRDQCMDNVPTPH